MSSGNQHRHNIAKKEKAFAPKVNVPPKRGARTTIAPPSTKPGERQEIDPENGSPPFTVPK